MTATIENKGSAPECACTMTKDVVDKTKQDSDAMTSLRLNETRLYEAPLVPVDCSFSLVRERPEQTLSLKDMVRKERKSAAAKVTVVFAVRNVGCGGCREHGMQLTELAEQEKIGLVGVVKETGVDDPGLLDFYQNYFHFPIYNDSQWNIYKSMGCRKTSIFKVMSAAGAFLKRIRQKKIVNKAFKKGDFFMQGGILIFDKKGRVRYALREDFGQEFDLEMLRAAIRSIRHESDLRSSTTETEYSEDSSSS